MIFPSEMMSASPDVLGQYRIIANEMSNNKTRSSSNIASDMIGRKQTDVLGREEGEGLEEIFAPIKEKGEEYFHDLQLYLFHRHNVARMSLFNAENVEREY